MGQGVNSTLLGESSTFALECTLWSVSPTQNLQTDVTLNPWLSSTPRGKTGASERDGNVDIWQAWHENRLDKRTTLINTEPINHFRPVSTESCHICCLCKQFSPDRSTEVMWREIKEQYAAQGRVFGVQQTRLWQETAVYVTFQTQICNKLF